MAKKLRKDMTAEEYREWLDFNMAVKRLELAQRELAGSLTARVRTNETDMDGNPVEIPDTIDKARTQACVALQNGALAILRKWIPDAPQSYDVTSKGQSMAPQPAQERTLEDLALRLAYIGRTLPEPEPEPEEDPEWLL